MPFLQSHYKGFIDLGLPNSTCMCTRTYTQHIHTHIHTSFSNHKLHETLVSIELVPAPKVMAHLSIKSLSSQGLVQPKILRKTLHKAPLDGST